MEIYKISEHIALDITGRKSNLAITPIFTFLRYSKFDLLASSMQALFGGAIIHFLNHAIFQAYGKI